MIVVIVVMLQRLVIFEDKTSVARSNHVTKFIQHRHHLISYLPLQSSLRRDEVLLAAYACAQRGCCSAIHESCAGELGQPTHCDVQRVKQHSRTHSESSTYRWAFLPAWIKRTTLLNALQPSDTTTACTNTRRQHTQHSMRSVTRDVIPRLRQPTFSALDAARSKRVL